MTMQELEALWESYRNGNISYAVKEYITGGFTLDDIENMDVMPSYEEITTFYNHVIRKLN